MIAVAEPTFGGPLPEVEPSHDGIVRRASDIEMKPVEWLWRNYIPYGYATMFDGDPGLGKSTAAIDVAARTSTGTPFPEQLGGSTRDPQNVLIMGVEDGEADVVVPRLTAAGADLDRIFFNNTRLDATGLPVQLSIPDDMITLRQVCEDHAIRLIIIDPLVAFFGENVHTHVDSDIRRALAPLTAILTDLVIACIALRHLNKDRSKTAMHRGGGSIAMTAAARSAFIFGLDPDDDPEDIADRRKVMAHIKTNHGRLQRTLAYATVGRQLVTGAGMLIDTSCIEWRGYVDATANEVAAAYEEKRGPQPYARSDAKEVLAQILKGGAEIEAKIAIAELVSLGITESTYNRAKKDLGVKTTRRTDGWYWSHPKAAADDPARTATLSAAPLLADLYRGDLHLKAVVPDRPCPACWRMDWIWIEGRGWHCNTCHPIMEAAPS